MNPTRTLTRPGDLLAQLAHPPSQIARADNPRADAEKSSAADSAPRSHIQLKAVQKPPRDRRGTVRHCSEYPRSTEHN